MAIFNKFYGLDMYEQAVPADVKELASSILLLCAAGQPFFDDRTKVLKPQTSGAYFKTQDPRYPGGAGGSLKEPLASEKAVWMVGTAFPLSRNTVATNKHNVQSILEEVESTDPTKLRLVSGFYRTASAASPFTYTVLTVKSAWLDPNHDYAILTTNEPVPSAFTKLQFATAQEQRRVQTQDALYMLGYPLGQPLKYVEGLANTMNAGALDNFTAWITNFAGNSGSPVFHHKLGKIIGLIYGADYHGLPADQHEFVYDARSQTYTYATYENSAHNNVSFYYLEELPKEPG
jgi:V8-like Glu-specific endopeptidase